jgi:hypothetical protein
MNNFQKFIHVFKEYFHSSSPSSLAGGHMRFKFGLVSKLEAATVGHLNRILSASLCPSGQVSLLGTPSTVQILNS